MANADVEKASYGAFERFLYIFLIPLIFTLILTGVLLSLFGYDVKETLLKVGHSIPIVGSVVPAPPPTPVPQTDVSGEAADVDALKADLLQKEAELSKIKEESQQKDKTIEDLHNQLEQMQSESAEKGQTDEEYQTQLRRLADIYTNMTPSKAAPILERLTMPELVLVLSQMKQDAQSNVLAKMNPQIAAEASIQMKDIVPLKDREMAALQSRLEINRQQDDAAAAKLSVSDLAQTFAGMVPNNAAEVLRVMMASDQAKVVAILAAMELQSRSLILSALSDSSKEDAAKISAKLSASP